MEQIQLKSKVAFLQFWYQYFGAQSLNRWKPEFFKTLPLQARWDPY